jgi:hypothetical protein
MVAPTVMPVPTVRRRSRSTIRSASSPQNLFCIGISRRRGLGGIGRGSGGGTTGQDVLATLFIGLPSSQFLDRMTVLIAVSEVDESSEVKRAEIEFALVVAIPVEHEQTRVVQVAIKPKLFGAQWVTVLDLDAGDCCAGSAIFPRQEGHPR